YYPYSYGYSYYQPYCNGYSNYQPYYGINLGLSAPVQPLGQYPNGYPNGNNGYPNNNYPNGSAPFRGPQMPDPDATPGEQPTTPARAPKKAPGDGTSPYDGGPSTPVPMPRIEGDKQPLKTPPLLVPLEGRPVSIPTTTAQPAKITYPAYGEK